MLSAQAVRKLLLSDGAARGYEVVFRERHPAFFLISELRLLPLPIRSLPTTLAPDRRALTRLRNEVVDVLAAEGHADDHAIEALESALGRGRFEDEGARCVAEALREMMASRFAPDGLPSDPRLRLRVLLRRKGYTSATLARRVGVDRLRLKDIVGGRRRFTPQDDDLLGRIETALDLKAGSLRPPGRFGRRGSGSVTLDRYPALYQHLTPNERAAISKYLPLDFAGRTEEGRTAVITEALALIAAQVTPDIAARRRLQAEAYALRGPLPPRVAEELEAMIAHHAGAQTAFGVASDKPRWADATALMRENTCRLFLGYLCHESRGAGRLMAGQVTLGFWAVPELVHGFLAFRHARSREAFGREAMTGEDVTCLEFGRLLMRPDAGWVAQSDLLADHLVPIPREGGTKSFKRGHEGEWLLSPVSIAAAQSDWPAFCARALADYDREIRTHKKRVARSRNAHEPILAILESRDPLGAFRHAIAGLQAELRDVDPDAMAWAEILRDLVVVGLQSQVAFRSRTLLALTWRPDHKGFLRKIGERWYLVVPRRLFKNPTGPFFKTGSSDARDKPIYRDYSRILADVDGLYPALDAYVGIGRARLLRDRAPTDALLLLSRVKGDTALTQGALQQLIKRVWVRHMLHNLLRGTGIPGVTTLAGPHAWRHILATGVWKRTGRLDLAADAIHDSQEMVKQVYGRYTPRDREDELVGALTVAFSEPLAGPGA